MFTASAHLEDKLCTLWAAVVAVELCWFRDRHAEDKSGHPLEVGYQSESMLISKPLANHEGLAK